MLFANYLVQDLFGILTEKLQEVSTVLLDWGVVLKSRFDLHDDIAAIADLLFHKVLAIEKQQSVLL